MLPPLRLAYPAARRPAPAIGCRRGKVAFFAGCVQDACLSTVNGATVGALQRNGYEVHFPLGQSCCGAAAVHTGEVEVARNLPRRTIDAFAGGRYDAIVNSAGGGGAMLLEYATLLAENPVMQYGRRHFEANVQDITAFLAANLHNPPTGHVQARATCVDSCHLRNGQRVVAQLRAPLKAIPGIERVEVAHPDPCCGSAGACNFLQPVTANQVLDARLADIIAVANTGRYMQMVYGVKRGGLNTTVMHVVELLDKSYADAR